MKQINPKAIVRDDFDEAIESTLEGLKSSPFIKDKIIGLSLKESELREHLATFLKMAGDHDDVQQCRLAGKCLKPQGHYVLDVHRNAIGKLERVLTPCPMLFDQLKVNRFMIYDDGDIAWQDPSLFDEIKMRSGRMELYTQLVKYLTRSSFDSLYLIGPHQTGKSFSLAVFAHKYALNELGTIGLLDMPKQLPRLQALKKQDEMMFQRELEKMQTLTVAIFDDINGLQMSEDMLMDILVPLFKARLKSGLITILSGTVPLEALEGYFKGYKDKKILMTEWIALIRTLCRVTITLPALAPFR
jgi:hypothetical protein